MGKLTRGRASAVRAGAKAAVKTAVKTPVGTPLKGALKATVCLALAGSLASCGGGTDFSSLFGSGHKALSGGALAANPLEGQWRRCVNSGGTSTSYDLTLSQTAPGELSLYEIQMDYSATGCVGISATQTLLSDTVTLEGGVLVQDVGITPVGFRYSGYLSTGGPSVAHAGWGLAAQLAPDRILLARKESASTVADYPVPTTDDEYTRH